MTRSRTRRLPRSRSPGSAISNHQNPSSNTDIATEQQSDTESEQLCGNEFCEKPLREQDTVYKCKTCGVIVCDHEHCRIIALSHDVSKHDNEESEDDPHGQLLTGKVGTSLLKCFVLTQSQESGFSELFQRLNHQSISGL